MGTPNNPVSSSKQDEIVNNLRAQVMRGAKLTSATARITGIDIEMLEDFMSNLKPHLPYLSGYKFIDEQRGKTYPPSIEPALKLAGITVAQVAKVLRVGSASYSTAIVDGEYKTTHFYFYLCHKGSWVVEWNSILGHEHGVAIFKSVRETIEFVYEKATRDGLFAHLEGDTVAREERSSLALRLLHELVYKVLHGTVKERRERLSSMEQLNESGVQLLDRVQMFYPR